MSDEQVIEQPTDDSPAEEQAQPPAQEAEATVEITPEDQAFQAQLEPHAIQIPDGDKLVPLSAVVGARKEIGPLKAAKEAAEAKAADLEKQLQQITPAIAALQALQAAQAAQPRTPQPTGPTSEQIAEYEAVAKDYDLYKADGTLDTDRAKRIVERQAKQVEALAERKAQEHVGPLYQRTVLNDAQHNFHRALVTEINGIRPDAGILKSYFDRIAQQPNGYATLADPNQVAIIAKQAITDTWAQQGGKAPQAQAQTRQTQNPPLFTEKAGGRDAPNFTLSNNERTLAREMYPDLTEAQAVAAYQKTAAKMPWR